MNKKLKKDIDLFISDKKVFNRTDEEKVFEKIKILEHHKPRKLQSLFPQLISVIGIGILISIVVGIFVVQSGLIDSNKRAQTPSEKNPIVKHVSNDDNKKPEDTITNSDQEKEKNPLPTNEYDFNTIQEGKKVGNWTLKELEKSPEHFKQRSYSATFTGDLTLTGTLVCLDHEEYGYGYGKGTVVFFPADRSLIPRAIQQQDKNLPLKVIGGGNEEGIFNINPGDKREGVSIRVQQITNVFDLTPPYKQLDSVVLFNENDTIGSFNRENAPEKLIMAGITYIKSENPKDVMTQFAERIGGTRYGANETDYSIVLKEGRVVLSYSPISYTVSYDYINEFREVILPNDPLLKGQTENFNKFMQNGETIEIRLNFDNEISHFRDAFGELWIR